MKPHVRVYEERQAFDDHVPHHEGLDPDEQMVEAILLRDEEMAATIILLSRLVLQMDDVCVGGFRTPGPTLGAR
jgi:hypothetical protein